MTSFAKLKDQRRRNAATIKRRNSTIRDLQWQVEVLRSCVDDYKFVSEFYKAMVKDLMEKAK